MNKLKQLASRLRACFAPRQGKSGSSLAFVMTIGAALVIWVMAIMPTMTATGTTAVKLQNSQSDYLDGRSAIEFAKSELLYIVKGSAPYTFAVVRDTDAGGNTTYRAIPKYNNAGGINGDYDDYVNYSTTDDQLDVPQNSDLGKQVAAICAVTDPEGDYIFDIVITAYSNCEPGHTYSTTYTSTTKLLIYPEAYNQTQALPLSDFVLVDGKLGSEQVWSSDISGIDDTSFTESLRPYVLEPVDGYADAGKYPAVFKMTAMPAVGSGGDSADNGGAILDNSFTSGNYIMPQASTDLGVGHIKFENGTVYISDGSTWYPITGDCTVYYNGSTTVPTTTGTYQVTVDFKGATYEVNDTQYPLLPATGLQAGTYTIAPTTTAPTGSVSGAGINSVSCSNGSVTVNLKSVAGAKYGYYMGTESTTTGSTVTISNWQSSNEFSGLDATKTYYFYCYVPGGLDQYGNVTGGSTATYCGMVAPLTAVTESEFTPGDYLVLGGSGSTVYAMNGNLNTLQPNVSGDIATGAVIYGSGLDFNAYTWSIGTSGSNYTLYNTNAGKYLQLTGEFTIKGMSFSLTAGNAENHDFAITFDNEQSPAAKVSRTITYTDHYDWGETKTATRYLNISSNRATQSDNSNSTVYFVKVPVDKHPNANTPATSISLKTDPYTITYGNALSSAFSSDAGELYLNGVKTAPTDTPAAGVYNVIGCTDGVYTSLGVLTVQRADRSTPSIVIEQNSADELRITVSSNNWDTQGTHYFGYMAEGEDDYHWFSASVNSFEFRLDYGSYTFAIYQGGTSNYNPSASVSTQEKVIEATYYKLDRREKGNFIYTVDDNTGDVTWYGPIYMTDQLTGNRVVINVNRITKVYYRTADTDWTQNFETVKNQVSGTTQGIYVGINIMNTNYSSDIYQVTAESTGITSNNGYTSGMLRGSQLYFMGETNSIDTKGNKLYLKADLLVLNNPINNNYTEATTGAVTGGVIVNPYSCEDTLVYFGNDYGVFAAKTVYKVKAGTDLCSPMSSDYEAMGTVTSTTVKNLFAGQYPEINLDIAYASKTQLMHIVSGETVGWTVDGVLKNSDTSGRGFTDDPFSLLTDYIKANAEYAVCAYVTEVSNAVTCTANRVLIAAPDDTGLTVPYDLHFTTRYLSLETSSIKQDGIKPDGNDIEFKVYNLGQNQTFIGAIMGVLEHILGDTSPYSSKTLQVDYECPMSIALNSGTIRPVKAQICRYEDTGSGINLFTEDDMAKDLLMVPYSASELASLYDATYIWGIPQTPRYARIVERYVQFSSSDGTITFDNSAGTLRYNLDMAIYANYLYIDKTVNKIVAYSYNNADIVINTQENGYAEGEYLHWFGSGSTESYNGTLVYVRNTITYKYRYNRSDNSVTIDPGFYFIPASSNGTSLSVLSNTNPHLEDYIVTNIKDYAIYVNADGTISQAYVDTGLFVSGGGESGSGFGGGSVG